MKYFQLPVEEVYKTLNSSPEGLTDAVAVKKLEEDGPNELTETDKTSPWVLFVNQFRNFMILVLIGAAIVAGVTGDTTDMIIILVIVLLNAVLGFVQEYRADKAMAALKQMAAMEARVMRDAKEVTVPASQLVVGDVVMLEAGNAVPADIRLIETHALRIDESALTGESVATDKDPKPITETDPATGDQFNMAFKGTAITNGRATGIVTATGMKTEIGGIAMMLQSKEASTPLQKRMEDFGKKISYIILGICLLLFGVGVLRGEPVVDMLMISISLAVAAIPEALPALITIALARGASRLVSKKALIRKLPAVETLGSVTYICTDKTGTLTVNKMKVTEMEPHPGADAIEDELHILDIAMAENNDVGKQEDKLTGDPTEIALAEHFIDTHGDDAYLSVKKRYPRVMELPFDSERKCMSTIHSYNDKFIVFTKGAAEVIVNLLTTKDNGVLDHADELAAQGLRILAFGYKIITVLPDERNITAIESELLFAGLVGMIDPPRDEAKAAVAECKKAGIKVVMITGDHQSTATAIAKDLGILTKNKLVVSGPDLKKMDDGELEERVEDIRVYARVSPSQKLDIVKALQANGNFVAMTGDGVNDAPSLKSANIGIAMGINGTDVSKQSAHMILLDDNFATIVKAVKEGRRIFDNIRKFVKYIMTCNGAEIWTIFLAPLLGMPIPLLPIHILWINLVTDGLPGLALAGEKAEPDIMERPPRKTTEGLFAGGIGIHIIWVGILMAAITLGVQAWALNQEGMHWQTMVFTVLSLSQLGHIMAIRSEKQFLFSQGIFSNLPLIGAVLFTIGLQMLVIYLPFANDLFHTQPLSLKELLICFALSAIVFHAVEFEKFLRNRLAMRNKHKK